MFLEKLEKYVKCDESILPFSFRLYDPSGGSYIQNPKAPLHDPNLTIHKFQRTME